MSAKTENLTPLQFSRVDEIESTQVEGDYLKKTFVEPEVSFPVDVLDATTFFQFTESGVTN